MKRTLSVLLLGLASRVAMAAAPPVVPAEVEALGLRLTLDEGARRLVQAKVNSLCRHQPSLEARVARAEAAFPVIDEVLRQEGVPTDFRYLVLQESALQADAESAHGAVGYWQLKRETALSLGLAVNRQVDERRHLGASTRAAARYLLRNNASLHNWADALLCYNLGPTGARAYISPADAGASGMRFTARTSPYLLDFVAQKLVFEPACAAGTVPFTPWREVPATPGQSLAQHAATLGVAPSTLAQLNTWLLAATVPQDGRTYTLLVPQTEAALASAPVAEAANEEPTDTLDEPAPAVPARSPVAEAPAPAASPAQTTPRAAAEAPGFHVVAPRETLYGVARQHGLRPADLAAWNNLPPNAGLQTGQALRLAPPVAVAPSSSPGQYVVAIGDTFYNIARRYRCTVADLLAHNNRTEPILRLGETLRVPIY